MRIHYRALYLSFNAPVDQSAVPRNYWNARMFARAVKYGSIRGYCHVPINAFINQRIDANNVIVARRLFGAWLKSVAPTLSFDGDAVLVPVPSKDAIVGATGPFRASTMLQNALANVYAPPSMADVLRFARQVDKAVNGGPRFANQVYPLLTLVGEVPVAPIVLVDDFATSCGHIKAARRTLEDHGCLVVGAAVCGRTVHDINDDPWVSGHFDIDPDF
jgi:hypothetical protein